MAKRMLLILVFTLSFFLVFQDILKADIETVKVNPVSASFTAGTSVSYNDNVALADKEEEEEEEDWCYGVNVGGSAIIPFAERHRLSLNGNLAATQWSKYDEINSISGGAGLNLDYNFDSWKYNFHHNYWREVDPTETDDHTAVTGVAEFQRYSYVSGLVITRDLGQVDVGLGYDYTTYRTEQEEFEDLDRNSNSAYLDFSYDATERFQIYDRYTYTTTEMETSFHNDSVINRNELGLRGIFTPTLSGSVAVGYETVDYNEEGDIEDNDDFEGAIYNASITHRLTKLTTHSLSVNFKPQHGYASGNFYKCFTTSYNITHLITPNFTARGSYVYDYMDESGEDPHVETAKRNKFGVGLAYQLTKKGRLSLDYAYIDRDSNLNGKDYTQNLTTLSYNHTF